MGRTALWTAIRDTLVRDISEGHYPPGQRLPTEAQLSERFGVNRHTVRRAIADMAEQNIVHSRRGAGVFVRHVPTPYRIGRRTRFRQNLSEAGRVPERRVLSLETRGANKQEAGALGLGKGEPAHVYEGISLSDGAPLALFCSVFPAARFPDLLTHLDEQGSVTKALEKQGLSDYTRKSTEITAKAASKTHATLLELSVGDPMLRTVAINVDTSGKPVEFGRTWFAADRVTLILGDGRIQQVV
ncbi:phosphonate metabolism transcriptional regulator PhnF [Rhodobacteraceae bacterium N5(2021)]|uniref:Phosphonate metabolism transcriptional regulator PhnF n=1 Tax=Gymnodinialimonas phycosphaerae TaxID=2841589 RepID=A0A975YEC5_9RHOB|nr:phosphonate metabolism transcriptional regulator PhnF [Gymnodinialimonas phycosphaerae]MBY4893511.1 phosphonate metabolism transcriptional regulator PhnF [Gymnodinialimonas phycosphaerae]